MTNLLRNVVNWFTEAEKTFMNFWTLYHIVMSIRAYRRHDLQQFSSMFAARWIHCGYGK